MPLKCGDPTRFCPFLSKSECLFFLCVCAFIFPCREFSGDFFLSNLDCISCVYTFLFHFFGCRIYLIYYYYYYYYIIIIITHCTLCHQMLSDHGELRVRTSAWLSFIFWGVFCINFAVVFAVFLRVFVSWVFALRVLKLASRRCRLFSMGKLPSEAGGDDYKRTAAFSCPSYMCSITRHQEQFRKREASYQKLVENTSKASSFDR